MKALLIDHDDSFTYNIKSWLSKSFQITVVHHLTHFEIINYDLIVISPGPKTPQDYPQTLKLLLEIPHQQAVLGICLGQQLMWCACGGKVEKTNPHHGKKSTLKTDLKNFSGLSVARYHSLFCAGRVNEFNIVATYDQIPCWIQHKTKKWMGFQFHPESFLTEKSEKYLDHLMNWIHP